MFLTYLVLTLSAVNPASATDVGPAINVAVRECTNYSCSKFQYGSGIVTLHKSNGDYVVITNRHVIEMARPTEGAKKTVYVMVGGNWIEAKEGGKSATADLALLTFRSKLKINVMPISPTAPIEGSAVNLYSFRRRGALLIQPANIFSKSTSGGDLRFSDYLSAQVWDGQSGGGVEQGGKLVGVIYARDSKPRGFRGLLPPYKYTGMGICVDYPSLRGFAVEQGYKFEASGTWKEAEVAPKPPVVDEKPKKFTRKQKSAAVTVAPEKSQGTTSAAPVIVQPNGKIAEINSKLSKLTDLIAKIKPVKVDTPKPSSSFLKRAVVFGATTAGLSIAGASGVGTAATVALWLYRRRKKRKGKKSRFDSSRLSLFNRRGHRSQPCAQLPVDPLCIPPTNQADCAQTCEPCPVQSVPITVQTPPTVQVHTENVYVPVELDTYREAVKYAHRQLISRYPSAEGTVAFIDGMVDRYLQGQKLKG